MDWSDIFVLSLLAGPATGQDPAAGTGEDPDTEVSGLEEFRGTDAERAELRRNGFVVTGRSLRQHFSASTWREPCGSSQPLFGFGK